MTFIIILHFIHYLDQVALVNLPPVLVQKAGELLQFKFGMVQERKLRPK